MWSCLLAIVSGCGIGCQHGQQHGSGYGLGGDMLGSLSARGRDIGEPRESAQRTPWSLKPAYKRAVRAKFDDDAPLASVTPQIHAGAQG